jgi:plastocyanin
MAPLLWIAAVGCSGVPDGPHDPEVAAFLGVPASTPIHRFDVVVRDGRSVILPRTRDVRAGDWVQFVAAGHRVHSIHFARDAFDDEAAWRFLEASHQTASPPLIGEDARFLVSFEGAPPGAYPFHVMGQGPPMEGVIRVR